MKTMATIFCFLVCIACSSSVQAATISPEKKSDIEKLLRITGSLNIAEMFAKAASGQIIEAFKKARPDIPQRFFDVINEETRKVINENVGQLIDAMVPIYDRNLNQDEIKGLINFYETPLGKKAITVMPVMAQEGMEAGQKWGESLWPVLEQRIDARLDKEGLTE